MENLHDYYTYEDGFLYNKSGHLYHNEDRDGYIRVRRAGKEYRAHRIIWELFNGPIPEGMLVDHIDGNVYNNRIENLRLATRQQNSANKRSMGAIAKGVTATTSGKYRVRISKEGVTYCLGTYNTLEEAAEVYKTKAEELNGEYAYHVGK